MAEQKFVDVVVTNNADKTVTLRYPEGHDMIGYLQKMGRREELAKVEVKPMTARKPAAK